ncbi:MAG TPA: TetR/AcrR family transcriptional regulator [Dongiaceae bacterium]|jgi:AcrR family transcriptional regulator|nr:TetR/AcrR family transcriptional regulator [Dongiaceae bacterium]
MATTSLEKLEGSTRRKGRCSLPERRQALLDAAREVFLEKGFANATIDEVVARAGGSKATVYSLFENKEGLFAALVAEAAEELAALLQKATLDGAIEDDLRAFGRRYLEILTRPERLALFRLVIGECGRVPEVGDIFYRTGPHAIFQRVVSLLRDAAARGQIVISDVDAMAHFFIDALRGHMHMQVLLNPTRRPTPREIERHVDFVVENFLRACRA